MSRYRAFSERLAKGFVLLAICLSVLSGNATHRVHAAPATPRGYTWALSAADFAAGAFVQTAFDEGYLHAGEAREGSYITPAHRAPFRFLAVGADWQADLPSGAEVRLEIRLSRDGESWSSWQSTEGEAQGERWFGEGLAWLDGAQWMQARVTLLGNARLRTLTLTAIDVSSAPALEQVLSHPATTTAAVPAPTIISRSAWGANESLMTWPPAYAPAKKVIIHHTVTPGGDNPIAEVQAIYYYHAVTRGWGDIGYNYVVDKYGHIYEGRFGGLDVIAGHTYGYNVGSVGIGNLGDYSTTVPSSAMLEANAVLSAWYGSRNYIHPLESSLFNDRVTPNITGHRDYAQTSCPGGAFYAQLPAIRTRTWDILRQYTPAYAAAYSSHDTPQLMLAGSTVEVRHTLRNVGTNTWYYLLDPGTQTPYHLGYHWYDSTGQQYAQPPEEDHRTALPSNVAFGELVTIPTARLTASHTPGAYTLKWDMVHEGVTWFATQGSPTLDVAITVSLPATVTGVIRDNRGAGVGGAQVALEGGARISTGPSGDFLMTNLFPGSVMLQAFEPGILHFPGGDPMLNLALRGGETTEVMLILPPFDNTARNSGFEAGLVDWIALSPPVGGTIRTRSDGHTGHGSAELAAWDGQAVELQQIVRIPLGVASPTLSLIYATPQSDIGDVLGVAITTSGGSAIHTLAHSTQWRHWWVDIPAAPGEMVTIAVRLQADGDTLPTTVHLDEVTLGSAGPEGWEYRQAYVPLVLRQTGPE